MKQEQLRIQPRVPKALFESVKGTFQLPSDEQTIRETLSLAQFVIEQVVYSGRCIYRQGNTLVAADPPGKEPTVLGIYARKPITLGATTYLSLGMDNAMRRQQLNPRLPETIDDLKAPKRPTPPSKD